ncbi:MAG: hypothetical protein AAGA25_13610 [Planctomycetota bacterium]
MPEPTCIVIGGKDALKLKKITNSKLSHRIAFVCDVSDDYDHITTKRFVLPILKFVYEALGCDDIKIFHEGFESSSHNSFDAYEQAIPSDIGDLNVPLWTEFRSETQLAGLIACELWCTMGGPWPYHDSCTFALYVSTAQKAESIIGSLNVICESLHISIPELIKLPEK